MRVLGIDFGTARVGIAVSDPDQRIASPLHAVPTAEALNWIVAYAKKEHIFRIAIGKPLGLDGHDTDATQPTAQFVRQLQTALPTLRICYIDERFTSKIAQQALVQGQVPKKKRQNKGLQDKVAAAVILQSYLAQFAHTLRPVQVYGHPALRTPGEPIAVPLEREAHALIEDMFFTMYHANGVGLAAPQLGIGLQLFVVGGDILPNKQWYEGVFINPTLTVVDDLCTPYEEGCLSLPGVKVNVERPKAVRAQYIDANGTPCDAVFDGFVARVIQHEYDHLQGKLIIDYASALKRKLLSKKLQLLEKSASISSE